MDPTLEQLVARIRREAVRRRWHVTDPFGPSPARDHVLLVADRPFRVRFTLTTSDWCPEPEFTLLVVEKGKQRPNRQAVERLVSLFFEHGPAHAPVVKAERNTVPFDRVRVFSQRAGDRRVRSAHRQDSYGGPHAR